LLGAGYSGGDEMKDEPLPADVELITGLEDRPAAAGAIDDEGGEAGHLVHHEVTLADPDPRLFGAERVLIKEDGAAGARADGDGLSAHRILGTGGRPALADK